MNSKPSTTLSKPWRQNASAWNKMPVREMHADTNLIRCVKGFLGPIKGKRVLYIGFGEGQNLIYLAKEGAHCYGTELAKNRITHVQKLLKKNKLKASLFLVNSAKLPFPKGTFDHVIAWQSLYYNDASGFKAVLEEIHRVMKPGGHFLSAHLSTKHTLCAHKLTADTYCPDIATQKDCILFPLKNTAHAEKLFSRFKKIEIGSWIISLFNIKDHHYVIHGQK